MDDPDLSWPAWKFGMKRDELFTTLHDKYNTFSLTIQDPEAFHHDVYELSRDADTADDFHRLLADRRQQRLDELHDSLRSLAVEIIANPKLMASDQWQHALQLFRTKSFDSIVRFFASYLPEEYLDRHDDYYDSTSDSVSEPDSTYTQSTKASSVDDAPPCHLYLDSDFLPNGPAMTKDKPCPQRSHVDACPVSTHGVDAPLSPLESEPMLTDETVSSPTDVELQGSPSTGPPSRSMSFSGSESDMGVELIRRALKQDDEVSQSSACDTAATSVSDPAECRSCDVFDCREPACEAEEVGEDEDYFQPTQFPEDDLDFLQYPDDTLDSETPTPRPHLKAVSTISASEPEMMTTCRPPSHHLASPSTKTARQLRREGSPLTSIRRTPEESLSKVQKPASDSGRKRQRGRI